MKTLLFSCFGVILLLNGCSQIKSLSDTLANLQRLQFKLNGVTNCSLAGIEISGKSKLSDFNPLSDGLSLMNAYRSNTLPTTFLLNMDVKNPNDGTNGTKSTSATLKSLDFHLLIDGKQTITGDIQQPFQIPASGTATVVPIAVSLNLMDYFKGSAYNDLINLAMAIGGKQGSAGRLTLDVKPTVDTPLGAITYPSRINVIDKEFRN